MSKYLFTGCLALALVPVAACDDGGTDAAPYELSVFPAQMQAVPGQRCVILVELTPDVAGDDGSEVNVTAEAGSAPVAVTGQVLTPGSVAEVEVIPDTSHVGTTLTVTVSGNRGGTRRTGTTAIEVIDFEDGLGPVAAQMRDLFIPFLETDHPELGITAQILWTGTLTEPQVMVVAHYLFFSDEWEMGVSWHVMIPPDDWADIYLRRRYTEFVPTLAFRIDSVDASDIPHTQTPPDEVRR